MISSIFQNRIRRSTHCSGPWWGFWRPLFALESIGLGLNRANLPNYTNSDLNHPSMWGCASSALQFTTLTHTWQCLQDLLMADQPATRLPPPYDPTPVVVAPSEFVWRFNLFFSHFILLFFFHILRKKNVFQHPINIHNRFTHLLQPYC